MRLWGAHQMQALSRRLRRHCGCPARAHCRHCRRPGCPLRAGLHSRRGAAGQRPSSAPLRSTTTDSMASLESPRPVRGMQLPPRLLSPSWPALTRKRPPPMAYRAYAESTHHCRKASHQVPSASTLCMWASCSRHVDSHRHCRPRCPGPVLLGLRRSRCPPCQQRRLLCPPRPACCRPPPSPAGPSHRPVLVLPLAGSLRAPEAQAGTSRAGMGGPCHGGQGTPHDDGRSQRAPHDPRRCLCRAGRHRPQLTPQLPHCCCSLPAPAAAPPKTSPPPAKAAAPAPGLPPVHCLRRTTCVQ